MKRLASITDGASTCENDASFWKGACTSKEWLFDQEDYVPFVEEVDSVNRWKRQYYLFCNLFEDSGQDKVDALRLLGVTKSVANKAFEGCSTLDIEVLPNGLTQIGHGAFNGCTKLALKYLPENLNFIWSSAFKDCEELAITSFPKSIKYIDDNAFENCSSDVVSLVATAKAVLVWRQFRYRIT